ncbi:MAG: ABC transporter ATP-binding protein [Mariprofundaceae bacterium]|nr:ABC transporter ATP-binding protein [Mariprofundaceae bacterium]
MQHYIWHASALHQALPAFLKRVGYSSELGILSPLDSKTLNSDALSLWLTNSAAQLDVGIQGVAINYLTLEQVLEDAGPAILPLPNEAGFLLLLGGNRKTLRLMDTHQTICKVAVETVRHMLAGHLETPLRPTLNKTLSQLSITGKRYDKAMRAMLRQQLSSAPVGHCYLLRLLPGDSFWKQLCLIRFPSRVSAFVLSMLAAQLLALMGWVVIGETIFHTTGFHGMLHLWALLLLTAVPLQMLSIRIKDSISLDFGCLLRKRLLDGVLQLKSAEVRDQGSGSFLGQVMNIEFLEGQCLSMVFVTFMALLQLLLAVGVLAMGVGGWVHASLLLAFLAVFFWLAIQHFSRMKAWILHARKLSFDLTENMVGHRTRLAQQHPDALHTDEDALLAHYSKLSELLDRSEAIMRSLVGRRGWLVVGCIGLYPALTTSQADIQSLTISIGGMLLAALSLDQLTQSFRHSMAAWVVWEQIHYIYQSSSRRLQQPSPRLITSTEIEQREKNHPMLTTQGLSFAYSHRQILDDCNLRIDAHQHLLLEGDSGGGKSTLAALLAGLQHSEAGSIQLLGLSYAQWGDDHWRKQVVIAPQFQENHVLSATFAFNLLMGRQWPPSREDLIEADKICRNLHLGDLLDSMPAGMQQMVGESGWRLSHGERSRLFIARTLLQRARLIILDESFAALDPETLKIALQCVLKRSNALLLIAHP